jgi:hypothetical protein
MAKAHNFECQRGHDTVAGSAFGHDTCASRSFSCGALSNRLRAGAGWCQRCGCVTTRVCGCIATRVCAPVCRACVRAVRAFVCRGASRTSLFLCGFSTLLPLPCVWYGLFREPSLRARGSVCGRAHSPCVHQLVGVVRAKRKVGVGRGDGQVVRTHAGSQLVVSG